MEDFTLESYENLTVGMKIKHCLYGPGVVTKIYTYFNGFTAETEYTYIILHDENFGYVCLDRTLIREVVYAFPTQDLKTDAYILNTKGKIILKETEL